ncbi:TPA: toll/interleukin-1 receptor domain-containing protein [Yersinia enterocolitica]|nr:toll/interleukin-1 receptor domain-containing protein [Yersinia enterocolitica]HDL7524324.1 toll/interleukin-1 receptor domain-containing protein [Yersinia enterocolitica]HDL7532168.1 toll/interleukin-1 receptor domain-containing protein [Yersinia enterocolitica]HDL7540020.1 toll/interleukin-1 receptor domain-containing protein [Yersinia enterocolitica]HDL7548070.1 toll/interleukin-1 receptor domain-containing protein [Yersinia enterocolitica]
MAICIPPKVPGYLQRVREQYKVNEPVIYKVLSSAKVFVRQDSHFDPGYNAVGHDISLFLPMEILRDINISQQEEYTNLIKDDLSILTKSIHDEWIDSITLELNSEIDPEYQQAISINEIVNEALNPDELSIWKPNLIRVFISHRDKYKREAQELANSLEEYGFSCFVAHETIEPLKEWRNEIVNGLKTMEVMLVLLTDDFNDSIWTCQEVGYALGANKPVVSLKVGKMDPAGFISHLQAVKGSLNNPTHNAELLNMLLAESIGKAERVQQALISTFIASQSFDEAKHRFDRMNKSIKKLTEENLSTLVDGFRRNRQLNQCIYLNNNYNRLKFFIERTTGKTAITNGNEIVLSD